MTGIPKSVSFSDLHYQSIVNLCKTYKLGFSEVVRRLLDSGLDRDATLGLSFHEERLKALQGEAEAVEATIEKLKAEAATSPKVFEETRTCNKLQVAPETDHDKFLRYVGNLGVREKSTPTTRLAARMVNDFLKDHPEWAEEVPADKRHLLAEEEGGNR
jgi:uncharacterized protein YigA (DUF484 family)